MQFTITAIVAFAAAAMAAPVLEDRQVPLCSGGGQAQCCATDVLNLADLDCATPPTTPTDVNSFIDVCSAAGQQAKCCVLPILGQALFCADVNPTAPATGAETAA
ncbi:fungal hydrophobin [Periconia macrospinosa]|uniref:Fungal hydrophobin n=1 Tax=Periconia macrospinosa TaxID=97972 RepID=A0A2V1DC30_9PLEO|nr:fungal hydrophobin [Periconia macrospinosa]